MAGSLMRNPFRRRRPNPYAAAALRQAHYEWLAGSRNANGTLIFVSQLIGLGFSREQIRDMLDGVDCDTSSVDPMFEQWRGS